MASSRSAMQTPRWRTRNSMVMSDASRLPLSWEATSDWSCGLPGSVASFTSLILLRAPGSRVGGTAVESHQLPRHVAKRYAHE